jgi:hypothetical protein
MSMIWHLFPYVLNTLSAKLATEVAVTELSVKLWGSSQFQIATYTVRMESAVKLWRFLIAGDPTRLNVYGKEHRLMEAT